MSKRDELRERLFGAVSSNVYTGRLDGNEAVDIMMDWLASDEVIEAMASAHIAFPVDSQGDEIMRHMSDFRVDQMQRMRAAIAALSK